MHTSTLPDGARRLLSEPVVATVATIGGNGFPHATPVWIDVEGDTVVFNTLADREKAKNVEANAMIAVSAFDCNDPFRALALQGTVVEVSSEGADTHVDSLAKKYLGVDEFPNRKPGDQRVIVRIRPERILMAPS